MAVITLSREIRRAIGDANSPTVRKWKDPENIHLELGLRVLEAAGTLGGEQTTGSTPLGELITRRGRTNFNLRMVDLASVAMIEVGKRSRGDDSFIEGRNRVAAFLGRAL